MDPRERISAIGALDERVLAALRALPTQPEVRVFRSLADDGAALLRFAPALAVVAPAADASEDARAMRLLRQALPGLGLVLVGAAARATATAELARRVGALALP
ncbi:MAG: hypothetical protein ACK5BN_02700, partial [Planctomycetota bacterium]